jgi:hypothetical protein
MYELSINEIKVLGRQYLGRLGRQSGDEVCYAYTPYKSECLVPISEIREPQREGGRVWFRSREHILKIIDLMAGNIQLPPIQVYGKHRLTIGCYIVRDGFHRYYACIALGYQLVPVSVNDWDFEGSELVLLG